nr:hypothetical protein CFP56_76476 [Quercus suber]
MYIKLINLPENKLDGKLAMYPRTSSLPDALAIFDPIKLGTITFQNYTHCGLLDLDWNMFTGNYTMLDG